MSPYPTVVMVVKAQYTLATYLRCGKRVEIATQKHHGGGWVGCVGHVMKGATGIAKPLALAVVTNPTPNNVMKTLNEMHTPFAFGAPR